MFIILKSKHYNVLFKILVLIITSLPQSYFLVTLSFDNMQISTVDMKHHNNIKCLSHAFAIIVLIGALHILIHLIINDFRAGPFSADCKLGETGGIQVFRNLLPAVELPQWQLNATMVVVLREK